MTCLSICDHRLRARWTDLQPGSSRRHGTNNDSAAGYAIKNWKLLRFGEKPRGRGWSVISATATPGSLPAPPEQDEIGSRDLYSVVMAAQPWDEFLECWGLACQRQPGPPSAGVKSLRTVSKVADHLWPGRGLALRPATALVLQLAKARARGQLSYQRRAPFSTPARFTCDYP